MKLWRAAAISVFFFIRIAYLKSLKKKGRGKRNDLKIINLIIEVDTELIKKRGRNERGGGGGRSGGGGGGGQERERERNYWSKVLCLRSSIFKRRDTNT